MAAASIPTPIPALEIEGPGGRVEIVPRSPDDRLGDLADAIGLAPDEPLALDGRHVARSDTLARAGVVRGSRLDVAAPSAPARAPVAVLVCEAGPAAGHAAALTAGRHLVGRSPAAAMRIDDPTVEPHHVLVVVGTGGTIGAVQLTGRVPCRIDGEPIEAETRLEEGATITLGSSRLRLVIPADPAPPAATVATAGNPWRRTIHRTPRALPRWDPSPIPVPTGAAGRAARAGAAGLLAAAFSAVGSVVLAVVMGSPAFLVFGIVGAVAALGMWLAGRVGAVREGRRSRVGWARSVSEFAAAVEAQRAACLRHHLATTPGIVDAVAAATTLRADVWCRRGEHGDAFRVAIGHGPVGWELSLAGDPPAELASNVAAAERFADVQVPVDLGAGAALAVRGVSATAIVRAVIVQLATWAGPADWCLVVVAADTARWEWCRWLPHAASGEETTVIAADDADEVAAALSRLDDGRHVVVVTDRPELLVQRTGALRRFLGTAGSAAVVAAVPAGEAVPAMCRSVLDIGSIGLARWLPDASLATDADVVHVAGTTISTAAAVARALAGLHDPEDPSSSAGTLPTSVALGELSARHGVGPIDDAIAIAARWRSHGADPRPAAPLGLTPDGVVEIDLVRDGPHALVAGTTGSGKSELLRTFVVSLAAASSPAHLTFVLVDYKGGATFDACADLPHTVGLVTDLDDRLAERALASLEAELRRRERVLRSVGAADLGEYRAVPDRPTMPRLVVVVDEFAALSADVPAFVPALVGIAQRGRSLGIHLVLATQRPAGVVSDDIRANTNLRLALRLHDPVDARDVVGDDAPATFPRGRPGRVMLRLGPDDAVVFQAAHSGESELGVLVESILRAAELSDVVAPHRPWLPALPVRLAAGELASPGAVGLVDVPVGQRRDSLSWGPGAGNLALIGSRGSGTTTALRSLVAAACRDQHPSDVHVYVIDAAGDDRLDAVAAIPHSAGVVRPHERERLARLLRRLTGELDRRRACADRGPDVIVAIDGLPALRAALDAPADAAEHDALLRIVTEGPGAGIACVMTAERPGAVPSSMLAACSDRWLFHLDDPAEATVCGIPPSLVPRAIAGRVIVASTRLEAQLAVVEPAPSGQLGGGPTGIGVLPRDVLVHGLPAGSVSADGELDLVVGSDFESLGPARLLVPDGEHILVAGPPRSGRSTALVRLAASWREAHPDGVVVAVAPMARSPLAAWPGATREVQAVPEATPALIVVDDAERVDDPSGDLARVIAERRPGVLVVAAARPDTLRTLYGHWTAVVRRSRTGLLMAGCSDVDGDLLGELLPRMPPIPVRPGLAWVVSARGRALAQVAW